MDAEATFLKHRGVSLFLDVGANTGQTGAMLRRTGYQGRIISFEPISECFEKLAEQAAGDPLWEVRHTGVGAKDGQARIGVSENLVSSSILEATDELIRIYQPIRYTRHEDIPLARLDSIFDGLVRANDVVHLKIDTQGFERFVIEGAQGVMDRIGSVRMEVAVSEVYKGEMIVPEAITMMSDMGYLMIDVWSAWRHPQTGEVLHLDLLFRKRQSEWRCS